ncbi:hypothetical protein FKW77_007399 [Venturia effusa]|uniref:C2H2-type domain-containing protein n=1 Tax=Venturia effusa TaxID=50376 RepID=A0A517KWT0_9PEZI|nr:hypothetical protein FKW77_007399 [Venturia effusa]
MIRSPSDFFLPDSRIGVGAASFVQTDPLSQDPGPSSEPPALQGLGLDSLAKFLTEGDSPWTGLQTHRGGHTPFAISEANLSFPTYRSQPQSEIESFATAFCPSDSGYGSQPVATLSVKSGGYPSQSPQYSLYPDFDNFTLSSSMPNPSASPPQAEDQESTRSTQRNRGGRKKCEKCGEVLKCPSDYRKHMLKHEKPNKCNVPGCSREEGFSTINDLQRHQKSKHGIGIDTITTSFKCASPSCKNQAKIWPRRDNFKQHILRMHKGEDVNASEIKNGTSSDGASMDAELAGMSQSYSEPQPPTIRPEELEMASSDTFDTADDSWLHANLSGGPLAHRSSALPAPLRHPQNFADHSSINKVCRNNASSHNLNTLAAISEIYPTIEADKNVFPRGHGHDPHTLSSLKASDEADYNDSGAQEENSSDRAFEEILARFNFNNASNETRKKILQLVNAGGPEDEMERNEEILEASSGSQGSRNPYPCPKAGCPKSFAKKASLTKHVVRHTKPWCCTHFGCDKTFGSKDDWKRHERNQVPTAEVWICQMPDLDPSIQSRCYIREYDREEFREHLREDHNLTDQTEIDDMTLESKIGYSHQWSNAYYSVNFWCGFCAKVIQASHDPHKAVSPGKGDDNEPSNHRWNHIGAHFDKEKRSMEDWTYWERPERTDRLENAKIIRESYDGKENPRKEARKKEKQMREREMKQQATATIDQSGAAKTGDKRKATDDGSHRRKKARKAKTTFIYWSCCECGNGPSSIHNHPSCPECRHERCDACEGNYARDGGEEAALLRGPYDSWGRDGGSPASDEILVEETGTGFEMGLRGGGMRAVRV